MGFYDVLDDRGNFLKYEGFKEILRLDQMLTDAGIPHILVDAMNGYQVYYPSKEERVCDAIEFCGTYGAEADLLEIMGLLTLEEAQHGSVCGWLTADDVFARIKAHYDAIASL